MSLPYCCVSPSQNPNPHRDSGCPTKALSHPEAFLRLFHFYSGLLSGSENQPTFATVQIAFSAAYLDRASSSSINAAKASRGCAPDISRPLMKNVGVPVRPSCAPSCKSLSTTASYLPAARQRSNPATSSPTSFA